MLLKTPTPETVPRPPTFDDEAAVTAYVKKMITARLRELGRYPAPLLRADKLEKEAVKLADHGNYQPLADLLRVDHPLNDPQLAKHPWDRDDSHAYITSWSVLPKGQIRSSLDPRTYELIADILDGKLKKRGRPPAAAKDRRKMTPVHDAAELVPAVSDILRAAFPNRRSPEIKDRALLIVARLKKLSPETLRNFLRRKPTDRRRLPST